MIEIHICPILMRTVRLLDGKCNEKCEEDCPIQEEINRNAVENSSV